MWVWEGFCTRILDSASLSLSLSPCPPPSPRSHTHIRVVCRHWGKLLIKEVSIHVFFLNNHDNIVKIVIRRAYYHFPHRYSMQ